MYENWYYSTGSWINWRALKQICEFSVTITRFNLIRDVIAENLTDEPSNHLSSDQWRWSGDRRRIKELSAD